MAAGAGLPGEGAEVMQVDPFVFPEAAGYFREEEVHEPAGFGQGEVELPGS